MQRFGKALGRVLLVLLALMLFVWFGPRERIEVFAPPPVLPPLGQLDTWLADKEAAVPNLRDGAAKRIVWANEPGARTTLSVVYLHGFSADPQEIRPLPDQVAADMGANLFFTRLQGHGRDGAAMAEPRAGDWVEDLTEALAIGRALGEQVIVIGTSTGGTLAAWAATDPSGDLSRDLAGIVLVSPNFEVKTPAAKLLTLPFVRLWGPLVAGAERAFEPINPGQAAHWTTRYPTVATLPMATLVAQTARRDYDLAQVPVLIAFADADQVVSAAKTRDIAAQWQGPVTLMPLTTGPGWDPYAHVLAGDILSPAGTPVLRTAILDWVARLDQD